MIPTAVSAELPARVHGGETRLLVSRSRPRSRLRAMRLAQVVLGLIWLIDGLLQFQPYMFGKTFITGIIDPSALGQPGIIAQPITWVANLIEPHVVLFNGFAATLQVGIGIGLLCRRTVKPALLVSFAWALGIWFSGEGLGMIFTGNASPLTGAPGAALLYIVVGLMCWPRRERVDADRSVARFGLLGEGGARRIWAALWLGSAVLWLLPANDSAGAVHDAIAAVPSGSGWLTSLLTSVANASAGHGTEIAVAMAVISAAVGIGINSRRYARASLVAGIGISLVYWVVGQGFGGVFTGQATDVSTAPLVILIAAMLFPLAASGSRSRASAVLAWTGLTRARRPVGSGARPDTSGLVAERLSARKRRVAVIRRRVVALTLVMFLALWSLIFVQLATGNDPALTANSAAGKAVAAAATTQATKLTKSSTAGTGSTTKAATSSSSSSTTSSGTPASSANSASSSGAASAVTTSQS